MGKALYRKYRSKSLSEIVGQEHITRTLSTALKKGNISHAYLFAGPHGVGKTSIARILAHEVNEFPYDENTTHVDIIEIDAASNRRIDEMRDLRDRVNIAPVAGKYKVYIIDEVHMLTREAFNALLKTLEEPPAHVIFILATTEAHKLPETIISRTQRHTFRPIEQQLVIDHLKSIAKAEKLNVSNAALALIARHGRGSFRDSISLLDQVSQHEGKIDESHIHALLGTPPAEAIEEIITAITSTPAEIFATLCSMQERGYSAKVLAHELAAALRADLASNNLKLPSQAVLQGLESLLKVEAATDPYARLELALLDLHFQIGGHSKEETLKPQEAAVHTPTVTIPAKRKVIEEVTKTPLPEVKETKEPVIEENKVEDIVVGDFSWDACLDEIKKQYNTLYGVLRMAEPQFDGKELTLVFRFGFHQKKINDKKHKALITSVIKRQCGQDIALATKIDANLEPRPLDTKPKAQTPEPAPSTAIDTISNIFGGAEVLE